MKKTILSIALASLLLSTNMFSKTFEANNTIDETHQVFVSKTRNISLTNSKKEFVYFGTFKELKEEYANAQKLVLEKGLDGALKGMEHSTNAIAKGFLDSAAKGIGAGIAFGIVLGLADPYVMALYADEEYILVYDYTNDKGEKTRISGLIISNGFDDEEVIKEYLTKKINEEVK